MAAGVVWLSALGGAGLSQEPGGWGGKRSFGFSATYSGDSSHILLGDAEDRRVWTLGAEYSHLMHLGERYRVDYEGSVLPLYEETDPTLVGTTFVLDGQTVLDNQAPMRVSHVDRQPVSTLYIGSSTAIPVYAVYAREDTYAASVSPLGVRIRGLPHCRVQPSMALDLGFVIAAREIPIDQTTQFNYIFAIGPGVDLFADRKTSWRIEYVYRHMSNAGQGTYNPGVDQGVVRLTISLHH